MRSKKRSQWLLVVGMSAMLAACGGGGGTATQAGPSPEASPGPAPAPAPAPAPSPSPQDEAGTAQVKGLWEGYVYASPDPESTELTSDIGFVVLPDGKAWGVYHAGSLVRGGLTGQLASKGTELGGELREFFDGASTALPARGAVDAGALEFDAGGTRLVSVTSETALDTYTTLAVLAGTYEVYVRTNEGEFGAMTLDLQADGQVTARRGDCVIMGRLTPRSDAPGVFDASFDIAGSCPAETGLQFTGVLFAGGTSYSATPKLYAAARTTTGSDAPNGLFFVGQRTDASVDGPGAPAAPPVTPSPPPPPAA